MLVYRKSSQRWSAFELRSELRRRLEQYEERPSRATSGALLLRAGELETALADSRHPGLEQASRFTDLSAGAFVNDDGLAAPELKRVLSTIDLPTSLTLRRPEGYAYYALDPLRYAELARAARLRTLKLTVLGIRSIGVSLSAVVCAALRARGVRVARASVRPQGHPFDRVIVPEPAVLELIRAGQGGEFMVVDEGPGLSGSSFLAAGELLRAQGVPSEDITFWCSHAPDTSRLVARDAARRWASFRVASASGTAAPPGAVDVSAGEWRKYTHADERAYPPSWPRGERVKFLFPEQRELQRFVGFPPYGERAVACATLLGEAGFSPRVLGRERGFMTQRWARGRYFSARDTPPLARMAEYLAFRAAHLAVPEADTAELEQMLRNNVQEALGRDLASDLKLELVRPVHADGRLAPHEWLTTADGEILKTDSADHGDDHLYPGSCDIAWDLAGAFVEWRLDSAQREFLSSRYQALSGDDPRARIGAYLMAYLAFRLGAVRVALMSAPAPETARFAPLEALYSRDLARAFAS